MPFEGAVRSRVASWLGPWLRDQPDAEIELGFLRCQGTWRDLEFDPLKLDPFIEGSTGLAFKQVRVAELSVRFNPWSRPNLRVSITGFHVILVPRELTEESGHVVGYSHAESEDITADSIDQEGAFLREVLENALKAASTGSWLKTSLTETLLQRCQFQFHDTCFQVQFTGDSNLCMLRSMEISLEPRLLNETSVGKGTATMFLTSKKESLSLLCECTSLEFGLKENGLVKILVSSRDPFVSIRLSKLKPVRFDINFPSVYSGFSPLDMPIFFLVLSLFSEKTKCSRKGKELWRIAAQRISELSNNPRVSWHKVVDMVLLWSAYVRAYELLLLLVGYPDENALKHCVTRVCCDLEFTSSVQRQLRAVDELERQLPVEAVGRARWIARMRVRLCPGNSLPGSAGLYTALRHKIFISFLFIWKFIYFLLRSVAIIMLIMLNIFKPRQIIHKMPSSSPGFCSRSSDSDKCVYLTIGEFSFCLHPTAVDRETSIDSTNLGRDISPLCMPSICLVLKSFFLSHVRDGIGRSLFLVLGNICVQLSPSVNIPLMESDLELKTAPSFRVSQEETGTGSRTVLWSEPAHLFRAPVVYADNEQSSADVHAMILENCLREVQTSWKMISEEVEENKMVQPFFLFELRENFISPTSDGAVDGLLRCIMALGKLNIDLEYESIISFIRLFGQILGSFQWMSNASKPHFPPNSFTTTEEKQANLEGQLQLCASRLKMRMLNMVPLKNIQVGVMVSGCNVKISFHGFKEQDPTFVWSSFSTCIDGIELSVWPASIAKLLEMFPGLGLKATRGDFLWLKEPQVLDIPGGYLDKNFVAQGRISHNAYMSFSVAAAFENLQDNQKSQAIGPVSVNINASTCRHYLHSFYSTDNACSLSLSGKTGKTDVFLYMDELWTLFQVFGDTILTESRNSVDFDYAVMSSSREYFIRLISARKDAVRSQAATRVKDKILPLLSTQFKIDTRLDSGSVIVILNSSRKNHSTLKRTGDASASATLSHGQYLLNLPDVAWGIFLPKSFIQISCEERKVKLLMNFSDIRSDVFKPEYDMDTFNDALMINHFCRHSRPLCEFFLPYVILNLSAGYSEGSLSSTSGDTAASSTFSSTMSVGGEPFFPVGNRSSLAQSHGSAQRYPSTSISVPHSGFYLMAEIKLGKHFLADLSMKSLLTDHQCSGLRVVISSTGGLHAIHFESQGGCFFLEMPTLVLFIQTVRAYSLCLTSLQTRATESATNPHGQDDTLMILGERVIGPRNSHGQENIRAICPTLSSESCRWWFFKFLDLNVSQFSLIFAVSDGSGGVQYITVEVDLCLRLSSTERNLSFNLLNLNLFSMHLPKNIPSQKMTDYTPVGSKISTDLPSDISYSSTVDLSSTIDIVEPSTSISEREISLDGGASRLPPTYRPSYILKNSSASIVVEKRTLNNNVSSLYFMSDWVGSGSISGFNLTITLSEIQMLMDLIVPLSGISSAKSGKINKRTVGLQTRGWTNDSTFTVPDGAIVAIQDLHQHLYFAIESVGVTHHVVGTLHYSLVGERALFRVNWHKGKSSLFSLTSLHAKDIGGEPLYLNYRSGSGFVEISRRDRGCALWKVVPYKAENYGDDDDVEFSSYCMSSRKAFYLVNHKNNSGVSFVDGFPEFVKNPGSPFKMKVFHELNRVYDAVERNFPSSHIDGPDESFDDERRYLEGVSLLHMSIKIERISIKLFHEISDADDKFPLVHGCIGDVHIIGQILPSKVRLICTYFISMDCFDAKMNSWRQMISPVDSCIFIHSRLTSKDSEDFQKGTPDHYYFRIKQMDISLTELSLDILLFIFGRLNVTGSYTQRSSIFCNCCKVENLCSLNLICHFADDQDVVVAGKKTVSVFLRHVQRADHLGEIISSVSVCAFEYGGLSTLPIHISLSDDRIVAWRTWIVSQQDSRTFPGPYLVAKVSMKTEGGLSLTVSPLSRIHNTSGLSMELGFSPQEKGPITIIPLGKGDTIDDSRALDGLDYSVDTKKAMISLNEGNFMLSLKPDISGLPEKTGKEISVDWSENLMSGKTVALSGIFDKLSYRFKEVFGVPSMKSSLTTVCCPLIVEGRHTSRVHFLIQITGRDVPVVETSNEGNISGHETSAFLSQKEIFISPTVQVFNLLQTEILVVLAETYPDASIKDLGDIGKHAVIPYGSNAYFYANPSLLYFTITLTALNSKCKPVDTSECVKKLHKHKPEAHFFDIELDFNSGKHSVYLRLSRGDKGVLEATVFSSFTLQNNTELPLFCFALSQKPLSQEQNERYASIFPPDLGLFLPPYSSRSWILKSNRVYLRLKEGKASESLLDLDTLSGFTELRFEYSNEAGVNRVVKVGVSLKACESRDFLPAQMVTIVPRHVISNESMVPIIIRQRDVETDADGTTQLEAKEKATLYMHASTKKSTTSLFDSVCRKHRHIDEGSLVFIQFRLKESEYSWSGPVCVSSLGRFFIKFKKELMSSSSGSNGISAVKSRMAQFASVHVVEESSTLVLHFHMPPDLTLPYRIENGLRGASITFYQKDSGEPETLGAGDSVDYVWDDQNLPHRLVVQISGMQLLREINIDKISPWKPFFKARQNKLLALHFPVNRIPRFQKRNFDESKGLEFRNLGYEVYADGLTRVLRICELAESYKEQAILQPRASFRFRMGHFAINLLEDDVQEQAAGVLQTFIVARLVNLTLYSLSTDVDTYFCAKVESINVGNKWQGAPFASMIRRSQLQNSLLNEDMLHCFCILHSSSSNVKEVKRLSLLLQPFDLNLDEETLMKLAAFWRTSLSDSKTQSQLYYFKQFEIHPLKIRTCFLPGNPYASYSSAQETLRSLLHTVIKVPAVKNTVIELNGVLLNHALLTKRELLLKCAQHYSWYVVRAVYIAKGSPLLPPAFASIFDDTASSSLDVFFDPSSGSINLPGFTLGMFKFVNKYVSSKGFSGTKRYLGDLSITMKKAGSSVLFAAITEISDSILRGAETDGFNGLVNGFHQGMLRLAMEPSLLGAAVMHGGPDRKIVLDQSPGVDELYIEGYLQAMLHVTYNQEYLQVKVIDNLVHLKNLPPNSALINEIVDNVKSFLVSQGLLKGDSSAAPRPLRHLRGETEWSVGPMVLTLCEHLFVSFAIRLLRARADELLQVVVVKARTKTAATPPEPPPPSSSPGRRAGRIWAVGGFVLSGVFAYVDGWLCRRIPNPIVRRIVSGFLLTFLEKKDRN